MRAAPATAPMSLDAFLEWEARQPERYECIAGEVRAMTGGTLAHNLITQNITSWLRSRLRGGPCRPYAENVKALIKANGSSRYPDVLVDCGPYDPERTHAAKPTMMIEVLSERTSLTDKTDNLDDYAAIPSVEAVLMVEQRFPRAYLWVRKDGDLQRRRLPRDATEIPLDCLDLVLPFDVIYEDVFPKDTDPSSRP